LAVQFFISPIFFLFAFFKSDRESSSKGIFVEGNLCRREFSPKGIMVGIRKQGNNDVLLRFCCIFVNIKPIVAVEDDLES